MTLKLTVVSLFISAVLVGEVHAQAPSVTAGPITAAVNTMSCTLNPAKDAVGNETVSVLCQVAGKNVMNGTTGMPAGSTTGVSVVIANGQYSVAILLSKGATIPDSWQISATDGTVTKQLSGLF